MPNLALVQTPDRLVNQFQQNVSQVLNPIAQNALVNGQLLIGISLVVGSNVINHGLARTMQGWIVSDVNGVSNIYRTAPFNDKTLTLSSSAVVTVNLYVF